MNARWTWILVGAAVALGAYTYITEPHGVRVSAVDGTAANFSSIPASDVTAIEWIRTNSVVRLERSREGWRMREPVFYPAQATAIDALLDAVEQLRPRRWMSLKEIGGREGLKAFGLDSGAATLNLETRRGPWILRLGGQTPLGGQFYFQREGLDGVFTADSHLLNLLPESTSGWRDRSLVDLREIGVDRFELRRKTPLEAVLDPASKQWRLVRPLAARANSARINGLLATLQVTPVTGFVSDSPQVDLDGFGLLSPEAEVVLSAGGRPVAQLQFGRAATNAPGQMFVRNLAHTNVILVPTPILVLLQVPLAEFRERQLVTFGDEIHRMELQLGSERTVVERSGTNWVLSAPHSAPVSPIEAQALLDGLRNLRIRDFPSDVVADYGRYGLNPPAFTVRLGDATNPVVELQFSARTGGDTVYARRLDEPGVYALAWSAMEMIPRAASQLRSLTFGPTQVQRVTVRQQGRVRVLERSADGIWAVISGSPGSLTAPALDETIYRLGHLDSRRWLIPDLAQMTNLPSARELDHELVFSFSDGAPLKSLACRILAENSAAAVVLLHLDADEVPVGTEVPAGLYEDIRREFGVP